ncbi:Uncharacterized protein APZ42_031685 [Daphnia magna]|uniref:Uncharacterized protein n=1 Tax=Daphnia magna TaxID=35525 RepID=A0A164MJ45_9CRUS|nr:Uncharacterized protein APZ42_031685 [Daphnia magna]
MFLVLTLINYGLDARFILYRALAAPIKRGLTPSSSIRFSSPIYCYTHLNMHMNCLSRYRLIIHRAYFGIEWL